MNTDNSSLLRIEAKLDTLIKLFALNVVSESGSLKDRAILLKRAGLPPKDIAALCDTTSHSVSVVLSDAKLGKVKNRGSKKW